MIKLWHQEIKHCGECPGYAMCDEYLAEGYKMEQYNFPKNCPLPEKIESNVVLDSGMSITGDKSTENTIPRFAQMSKNG